LVEIVLSKTGIPKKTVVSLDETDFQNVGTLKPKLEKILKIVKAFVKKTKPNPPPP